MEGLIDSIRNRQAVLFVGAGVSMNLQLPSWAALVREMGSQLGYDPDLFEDLGDHLELAEYYEIQKASLGPLRSWMDNSWHNSAISIADSEVHRLIVDLDFPIIYTTNYDRWIERAYEHSQKTYVKIANIGDIARADDGVTQIVKFHGDFDDDNSLVLTESAYFGRRSFETPLDIKLRADILGKSILFIGYSLRDINIRYLLFRLNRLWDSSPYKQIRPKSYIFLARPNPVQEAVLRGRGITAFFSEGEDEGKGLTDFLARLRSSLAP
jgi:hypothetical protein